MLAIYGDPEVVRWVGDGTPLDRAGCEPWVEVTERNYASRGLWHARPGRAPLRDRGWLLRAGPPWRPGRGGAQVRPAPRLVGKGLATEATVALLAYGATHFGLTSVIATTAPENEASHRVLRKAGMERGELRREDDGSWTQVFLWHAAPSEASPMLKERL
jgi:RimJ/RimL family protein N-acetyltransferase